jgi:N-succinyl-L-ornithine transcarbamylase
MRHFTSVHDTQDPQGLADLGISLKKNPFAFKGLGENKSIGIIFLNPSLRTRLSTQKAAQNLGMNAIVMNFSGEGYNLETEFGVVMNGTTQEHIKEAAGVIGQYFDIIAIRSFPLFEDRDKDYADLVINAFKKYSGRPVINMESSTTHPLQSLTDLITITELKKVERPKVVLTWAPHPKRLPQAVGNSFAQWMNKANVDFVVTHPEGYELSPEYQGDAPVVYDQKEAFEGADFIYAKNWSTYEPYGEIQSQDPSWVVDEQKMALTNEAKFMHCLPVRRNVIVSDGVIDSPNSVVIRQAGNREWAAQAVIKTILETNL